MHVRDISAQFAHGTPYVFEWIKRTFLIGKVLLKAGELKDKIWNINWMEISDRNWEMRGLIRILEYTILMHVLNNRFLLDW